MKDKVIIFARSRRCREGYKGSMTGDMKSRQTVLSGVLEKICRELGVRIERLDVYEKEEVFALVTVADIQNMPVSFEILRNSLEMAGEKLDACIRVQREELFQYMHRI